MRAHSHKSASGYAQPPLREKETLSLTEFHGCSAFRVVVGHVIDSGTDGIAAHQRIVGLQQFGCSAHIRHAGVEPKVVGIWVKNDWHAVMHGGGHGIRGVVRIEQVSTVSPFGPRQRSHIPANANNSPSATSLALATIGAIGRAP